MFVCFNSFSNLDPPTISVRCCYHLCLHSACHSLMMPGPVLEQPSRIFLLEKKSASVPNACSLSPAPRLACTTVLQVYSTSPVFF